MRHFLLMQSLEGRFFVIASIWKTIILGLIGRFSRLHSLLGDLTYRFTYGWSLAECSQLEVAGSGGVVVCDGLRRGSVVTFLLERCSPGPGGELHDGRVLQVLHDQLWE